MAAPSPSHSRAVDRLRLPHGELQRREAEQAFAMHAALVATLRINPRLVGDELFRIFRAESFERFERAFTGLPS